MIDRRTTGTGRPAPKSRLLWIIWGSCAALSVLLYICSPQFMSYRGVAEVVEFHPAASETARVKAVPVLPGQRVTAGDVVAVLDPAPIAAEIEVLAAELARAEVEIKSRERLLARDRINDERQFSNEVDRAEIALLSARVRYEADTAELAGVRDRLRWWQPMVDAKAAPAKDREDLKAEEKVLERRVSIGKRSVASAQQNLDDARSLLKSLRETWRDGARDESIEADIAPFRQAVEVARARLARLQARRDALTIKASGDGVVQRVRLQPGDVATAGDPIVDIRAGTTRRVLAFVSDVQATLVGPGTMATVIPRDGSGRRLPGRVLAVGAGVRAFPDQILMNPNWREFGQEIVIYLDEEGALAPGQVVDITFSPGASDRIGLVNGARAAEGDRDGSRPRKAAVPDGLRARTRLEPSGLVWLPEMDRFLVVSDDTGRPGLDEHAPWLFLMDRGGVFDAAPAVVEGIDELNDLESITRAPDGTIWVLSSQSISRKGNRPASRTMLVAVRLEGGRLKAAGWVSLVAAIAAQADEAWLESLGISGRARGFVKGIADFDRVLDIEGMAWDGGGLLLGLKEPLDANGRAIVWRLDRPDRLLATGKLDRADLVVYGRVALTAGPPDAQHRAGIADLCRLGGGGLVIAATNPVETGSEQQEQGAIWYLPPPVTGGEMTARKINDFPGARPEGIAPGPVAGILAVVFDAGDRPPLWMGMLEPR